MSLATRTRFPELDTLRERIDRLFAEFAAWPRADGERQVMPIDLQETDDELTVTASLPGIRPEDVSVEVDQGVLTIRGESREERDETRGAWHIQERRTGSVQRAIALPVAVDADSATATLKDGVLSVTLKKTTPTRPRSIPVKTG